QFGLSRAPRAQNQLANLPDLDRRGTLVDQADTPRLGLGVEEERLFDPAFVAREDDVGSRINLFVAHAREARDPQMPDARIVAEEVVALRLHPVDPERSGSLR